MLAFLLGHQGDKMEQIQFFNYLFSIGALVLSVISIYIAIQADKIKEELQKELKDVNDKIRIIKDSASNSRR